MNKSFCNVLIFGAGIIGSSLALRLAQSGITVTIIDHKYPINIKNNIIPSVRVAAINYASVEFFKKIDIWKNVPDNFYTSYYHMEVWEWVSAKMTFHSKSIGLAEMGRIIENNRLQLALWRNISRSELITLYCPSTLISLEYDGKFWKCILNQDIKIYSQLLIGADGTYSQIRKKLGIGVLGWKYNQCCMLLTIKTEKNKQGTIWQVFTPNGPIGFLPLYDHWGSLMWFDTPEYISQLQNLPKLILEKKIENKFYKQLGKVTLYNVSSISLINQQAQRFISLGGALVGDAAHTIHPLAGQGINLGIRDIVNLSELLIHSNIFEKYSTISEKILMPYQNNRQRDIYIMQASINWLYFMFQNNYLPLKIARNVTFMTIEKFSYIKKRILKYAALGI